ncbi:hypothetical protein SAMN05720615_11845 [Stenotrophomonas indicatrix]|nr:hypothetical protein SAMN05720615_109203 [Stenotrophomonas indicatrix]SEU12900.1 hypothetical protein SAMN05720615_11845 [Stenotrophomonas indicatrix]
MAYRFYNPAPVFFNLPGLQPVAGGSLQFYQIGTTTPKGTWSDPDMTIPNANPVPLDSSGRANTNIWLDGSYSVRLLDSLGATIWTRDVDSGVDDGLAIPALQSGKFLTNDGSTLQWDSIRQAPDPTGSANKILSTDGSDLIWIAQPTIPASPVVTTDTSVKITGASSVILDQWGTGSIPASGTKLASTVITFPTAYVNPPTASVGIARGSGVVSAGFIGCLGWTTSTTQLTVYWDLNIDAVGSQFNLSNPIPITWRAVGKVAS